MDSFSLDSLNIYVRLTCFYFLFSLTFFLFFVIIIITTTTTLHTYFHFYLLLFFTFLSINNVSFFFYSRLVVIFFCIDTTNFQHKNIYLRVYYTHTHTCKVVKFFKMFFHFLTPFFSHLLLIRFNFLPPFSSMLMLKKSHFIFSFSKRFYCLFACLLMIQKIHRMINVFFCFRIVTMFVCLCVRRVNIIPLKEWLIRWKLKNSKNNRAENIAFLKSKNDWQRKNHLSIHFFFFHCFGDKY